MTRTPQIGLSLDLWPVHIKPKLDELLSSWLVRLAMGHGQKLHTFCSITWPSEAIWNRDIDKSANAEVTNIISEKTATSLERVHNTTLAAYEGILYERHNHFGPNPWIMPIGVYHRKREKFGLQYCPRCLAEDCEPYFRRSWRLAFVTICDKHQTQLNDRCPQCGAAVNFHRDELGKFSKYAPTSMTICPTCNYDLKTNLDTTAASVTAVEVSFVRKLLTALADGFIKVSNNVITYSHLFFSGLRQMMKILSMRNNRIDGLRRNICNSHGIEIFVPDTETKQQDIPEQNVSQRRLLLGLATCLLDEWPDKFIALSQKHHVWSSLWLSHLESGSRNRNQMTPFWYWKVVRDYLYLPRYQPSDGEIRAAIKYLEQNHKIFSKSSLARLLGVSVIR
jgi:hypothetical protein